MPENISTLPVYHCRRIECEIAIDGGLTNEAWQTAETVLLTRADNGSAGRFRTELRLLYGPAHLYIGFQCEDTYVWGTLFERDAEIYTQECVEAFLCPSAALHQYYEINVSPHNTVFDACILNRRDSKGLLARPPFIGLSQYDTPGLRTAVRIDGQADLPNAARGWTVEYAIPYAALIGAPNVPPQPGDRWRANFYRIDAPPESEPEYYAWSTTCIIDFHQPHRFGYLEFMP